MIVYIFNRTILISLLIGSCLESIVQVIYTSRIWIRESQYLNRSAQSQLAEFLEFSVSDKCRPLVIALALLVFAQLVTSIIFFAQNSSVFANLEMNETMVAAIKAMDTIATVVDFALAGSFAYFLHKKRDERISASLTSVLNQLILYTVGSGFLTGLCGLTGVVAAVASPSSYLYLLAGLIMPKRECIS